MIPLHPSNSNVVYVYEMNICDWAFPRWQMGQYWFGPNSDGPKNTFKSCYWFFWIAEYWVFFLTGCLPDAFVTWQSLEGYGLIFLLFDITSAWEVPRVIHFSDDKVRSAISLLWYAVYMGSSVIIIVSKKSKEVH